MRLSIAVLFVLTAYSASSQVAPPDVLPDSVRESLQIELREMARTDQRVRYMYMYGTFSPCSADSLGSALRGLSAENYIARSNALQAEAEVRVTPQEKAVLLRMMTEADAVVLRRLREIISAYGWPSDERTGADANPVVFLLHASHKMDEMRVELLAEVLAGRLPALEYAMALDKSRKVRGELQLYGTGDEYDPETQSIKSPRIANIEATNAARGEIGLPPLTEYRTVD